MSTMFPSDVDAAGPRTCLTYGGLNGGGHPGMGALSPVDPLRPMDHHPDSPDSLSQTRLKLIRLHLTPLSLCCTQGSSHPFPAMVIPKETKAPTHNRIRLEFPEGGGCIWFISQCKVGVQM